MAPLTAGHHECKNWIDVTIEELKCALGLPRLADMFHIMELDLAVLNRWIVNGFGFRTVLISLVIR